MNVTGIVAEYNPFHNGHLYHLRQAVQRSDCNYVVCVMSGNFTQRGEPAMTDKWTRARAALQLGVDVVLELPFLYAAMPANRFAYGAVKILSGLGPVTHLAFGSEDAAAAEHFRALSKYLHTEEFQRILKSYLAQEPSYPVAYAKALAKISGLPETAFSFPNNILALEYLKALDTLKSPMAPLAIQRQGAQHKDIRLDAYASGSAIRRAREQGLRDLSAAMPFAVWQLVKDLRWVTPGDMAPSFFSRFRTISAAELQGIFDVNEGLENRLIRAFRTTDYELAWKELSCKRYSNARLQRILLYALLNVTQKEMAALDASGRPVYARILGFRRKATPLLREIQDHAAIPVITKAADFHPSGGLNMLWKRDLMATDFYSLLQDHGPSGRDYIKGPVIV
ncbi:nucleotidyltransferase [Gehongia tenuis]|uniref:tRNA(Met) cytidine acetate ligase n=1 Tax=Gehongia tenuis TaxID=2763655 RepID=A0A926D433_9FIRM|nr:nucleotidyltransferase [Gehongia tenuis]MBC8530968.1 nucleotidyltransferase [Gehongia tenuis]